MTASSWLTRAARGAAAGLVGSLALQTLHAGCARYLPGTIPPLKEPPDRFLLQKAEQLLPFGMRAQVPEPVENAAVRSLACGYGLTVGALYGAFCPGSPRLFLDGAAVGAGCWAISYLGWLPAAGLTPPISEQSPPEVLGPLVRHVLFGFVTAVIVQQWPGCR